jgi:hypothetical protein
MGPERVDTATAHLPSLNSERSNRKNGTAEAPCARAVAWPGAAPNDTVEVSIGSGPWRYFSDTLGHGGFSN